MRWRCANQRWVLGGPPSHEPERGIECGRQGKSSFCWVYLQPHPRSVLHGPSPTPSEALPPSRGAPLQCNWLWQPHTWQQCGWWRGSFEHRRVVLQRGDRTSAGGCESPRACDWWYGSVSEPICHICPCHFASARWLHWPHKEHT